MRKLIPGFWLCYFFLPLLYLLYYLAERNPQLKVNFADLFQVSLLTVLQASLSTLGIMLLATLLAWGLLAVKNVSFYKPFLVLPAFTPSLFVMTSVLSWVGVFGGALRPGLLAVLLIHILMNVGLASVLIYELILNKVGFQWQLAQVEGANSWHLFKTTFGSLKSELIVISAGFFLFCFTSFSIPLILGGHFAKTLEVFAYENLVLRADLLGALIVAFVQMTLYAMLLFWVKGSSSISRGSVSLSLKSYGLPWAAFTLTIVIFALCYVGLFWELSEGYHLLTQSEVAMGLVVQVSGQSLLYAFFAGLVAFLLFSFLLLQMERPFFRKIILIHGAVSVSLLGIALYIWKLPLGVKLVYAYSVLYFPMAYRFYGPALFADLYSQNQVLLSLGGSRWLNFTRVLLPQALPRLFRLCGLVAVWSLGDFALSSVITGETHTLALFIKTVLSSYRTELASALCLLLLSMCVLVYVFFEVLSYVSRKRFLA